MRSYRCRQRNEEMQIKVTVNREDITAALVAVGALPAASVSDDEAIERALTTQIVEWARAWGERA